MKRKILDKNIEQYHLHVKDFPSQSYTLLLPSGWDENSKVLVCVHGISRKHELQVQLFQDHALNTNTILIVPYFSKEYHPSYQRHKIGVDGVRSDEVLNNILSDIHHRFSLTIKQFSLFGFSAGAQFSHRYAIRYPHKIATLILCASGWYTFPHLDEPFPYGVGDDAQKHFILNGKNEYNLNKFLQIPMTIAVGEWDHSIDASLNTTKRVNNTQGYTRLQRAMNWTKALFQECQKREITPQIKFVMLQNSGHSFTECIRFGGIERYIFD